MGGDLDEDSPDAAAYSAALEERNSPASASRRHLEPAAIAIQLNTTSDFGAKRTCPPTSTVEMCQFLTHAAQHDATLISHLVGARKQRRRDRVHLVPKGTLREPDCR
jgi:hypothetical protein